MAAILFDNKVVRFHVGYTLFPYMNTSHLIMPLYSLRFLSAGRPKQRSNSVWLLSTSVRQPCGQRAPRLAEGAVQLLGLLLLHQPLAVGRVGHQLAVGAVPVELAGMSATSKRTQSSTPALRALSRAMSTARGSMSPPQMS